MLHLSLITMLCAQVHMDFPGQLQEAAEEYHVEQELLLALVATESRCKPKAHSSAGAIGYTQIMPNIWTDKAKNLGLNIYLPADNLKFGAWLLNKLETRYGRYEALRRYIGYHGNQQSKNNANKYANSVLTKYNKLIQQYQE